jgi:hypothetical protein
LQELLSRLSRFEPQRVAEMFAETIDWDVAGDERVPWAGARSSRDEVAAYFDTLWSVCDTAVAENTPWARWSSTGQTPWSSGCSHRPSGRAAGVSRPRWRYTSPSMTAA